MVELVKSKFKSQSRNLSLDKYRKNNDGTVRAFEVYSYRIAYQVTTSELRILRVRHANKEPLEY